MIKMIKFEAQQHVQQHVHLQKNNQKLDYSNIKYSRNIEYI